ncbi:hypothetical protein DPMN_159514 [Dreissena polymorpha]|uniref:Uncharacterized protein n=1 Tax=Dreissena polymorpha TaxID=45954 RepID=A0A9D4EJ53_DREPO|nr:hypothetical protein DPMN_159514 [Dreissena polymorpha]
MDGEYTNCNTTGLGAHVSTDRSIKDVPQAPVNGSTSPVNVLSMATVRTDTSSSNKAPRRLPQRKSIVPRRDNDDDFHQPTRAIEATISPKSLKVTEQDASTNGKFSYTPFENEQQQVVRRKPGQTAACDVADIKVEFVGTRRTHASADTSVALDEMLNGNIVILVNIVSLT